MNEDIDENYNNRNITRNTCTSKVDISAHIDIYDT